MRTHTHAQTICTVKLQDCKLLWWMPQSITSDSAAGIYQTKSRSRPTNCGVAAERLEIISVKPAEEDEEWWQTAGFHRGGGFRSRGAEDGRSLGDNAMKGGASGPGHNTGL